MNDQILIGKAYVEISSYRLKAMKAIGNETKIPTQIANDCGIRTNHISKVLRELKDYNLVECINEEMRKGRLYRLTAYGKQILEVLK